MLSASLALKIFSLNIYYKRYKYPVIYLRRNIEPEEIIDNELNGKRPVVLRFANLKDFGHSLIIDGYYYKRGFFWAHIKFYKVNLTPILIPY